jgi:hypothetical protein
LFVALLLATACDDYRVCDAIPIERLELAPKKLSETGLIPAPPRPLELPGSELDQQALGYLHANCSHCHNSDRPERKGARCYDPQRSFDFALRLDSLESVEQTPGFKTVSQVGSGVLHVLENRYMPPIAVERVDQAAVELLGRWIARGK